MKKKLINRTVQYAKSSKPTVRISRMGVISFTKGTEDMVGLRKGGCVEFYQDENSPEDWYLKATTDSGLELRHTSGKLLVCNSIGTAKAIMNSLKVKENIVRIPVAIEPEDGYWALLTAAVK